MATKSKRAAKRSPNKKVSMKADTSLVLRVCAANMTSHNEFLWPGVGEVAQAKDWKATKECGNGLHGWLYGAGDHDCTSYHTQEDAKWLVIEVDTASLIHLGGKVKFPYGTVRFVGARKDATDYLHANEPRSHALAVIGAQRQVGDKESVIVGNSGTATAGELGEIRIRWWDGKRYRTENAYVGENGIEPNVAYKLDAANKFVRARP